MKKLTFLSTLILICILASCLLASCFGGDNSSTSSKATNSSTDISVEGSDITDFSGTTDSNNTSGSSGTTDSSNATGSSGTTDSSNDTGSSDTTDSGDMNGSGDTTDSSKTDNTSPDVPHKHVYSEWTATKEPTCTENGLKEKTCSCGETLTEEIKATGHNYVNGCCDRCGEKISVELEYTLSEDSTYYTVSGMGTCTDTELYIPSTYEGLPVTRIGYNAFAKYDSLTSVTIPDSVTNIDYSAFSGCTSLTSVTIGKSVAVIDVYAFHNCTNLTQIYFNATEMTDLNDNNYVFHNAGAEGNGITLNIGSNVTKIPSYLFYPSYSSSKENLTSVIFEENSVCTSIGDLAFYYCTSLTSITIPDSVTSIGGSAFRGCTSLKYNEYDNGYYMGNEKNPYLVLIEAKNLSISSCKINENTKIICSAFQFCKNLTSITIPNSVISIGDEAFRNCESLTEINFNATEMMDLSEDNCLFYNTGENGNGITVNIGISVSKIPNRLFAGASKLTSVVFEENSTCTSIGDDAFYYCTSLTSVTIPDSVTSIGDCAFQFCKNLTSITIPNSVISIGDDAFYYCTSLTSVTIPDSVKSMGNGVFDECISLTEINFNATEMLDLSEDNYVFDNAGENGNGITVHIGSNVTKIPSHLFAGFPKLTSVVFEENSACTSINDFAFAGCISLTSITMPNSITMIGDDAFRSCTNLTSITIPDNVTSIGNSAFEYCQNLTSVIIPDSVTSISERLFFNCYRLTSVTIPNSVTSIDKSAFAYCRLTSITIPDSVISIGETAFLGCILANVVIPNSVTNIGNDAFYIFGSNSTITPTIYCEASYQPVGWGENWAKNDCEIVWGTETLEATVTVLNQSGEAVCGAHIQICQGDLCYGTTIMTDESGTCSIKCIPNDKQFMARVVSINSMSDFYESSEFVYFDTDSQSLTICIQKVTVNVVDDQEQGISGATVQLYQGEKAFKNTLVTDNDGKACAYVALNGNEISVKVTGLASNGGYELNNEPVILDNENYNCKLALKKTNIYFAENGLELTLSEDSTHYTVSGIGNCTDSDVIIPNTHSGLPVTKIGKNAFKSCMVIKTIYIPENIIEIGSHAFYNCIYLESVTFAKTDNWIVGGFMEVDVSDPKEAAFNLTEVDYQYKYVRNVPSDTEATYTQGYHDYGKMIEYLENNGYTLTIATEDDLRNQESVAQEQFGVTVAITDMFIAQNNSDFIQVIFFESFEMAEAYYENCCMDIIDSMKNYFAGDITITLMGNINVDINWDDFLLQE